MKRPSYRYLPPPGLGSTLLSEFLVDFNTAYPLYRPHVIADHLRVCYSGASDGSAVAWCSAYVVFGLAYMLRGSSATATKQDNELARYYLARNYISLNRLLLSPPSLGLVQCLIGVALLVQSTPCGLKLHSMSLFITVKDFDRVLTAAMFHRHSCLVP